VRRHLRYPPHQLIPTLGLGECRPARHEQTRTSCADRRVERCSVSHPPQPGLRGRPGTASAFPALLALPLAVCRQYRRPSSSSCRAVLTRSSGGIASSRARRSSFSSAPILGLPKARSNSEFAATAITRRSASGRSETPPARAMYRGVRGRHYAWMRRFRGEGPGHTKLSRSPSCAHGGREKGKAPRRAP